MQDITPRKRRVEINILSAEDLRINGKSIRSNSYVVIKTDSDSVNHRTTDLDRRGDSYPTWNEILHVNLPMHTYDIIIEVHRKSSSGDRHIGTARIPVSDFIGDYTPENYLHFLSYRLRDSKGYKNGIINFSVRVINMVAYDGCSTSNSAPPKGAVPTEEKKENQSGGNTVTGIPIWFHASQGRQY